MFTFFQYLKPCGDNLLVVLPSLEAPRGQALNGLLRVLESLQPPLEEFRVELCVRHCSENSETPPDGPPLRSDLNRALLS